MNISISLRDMELIGDSLQERPQIVVMMQKTRSIQESNATALGT